MLWADTEDMNRGRAETHLRQLAEAELRRATAPSALGLGHAGTLPLVAQALIAVGAIDVSAADEIQAELDLALAARQPSSSQMRNLVATDTARRMPMSTRPVMSPECSVWRRLVTATQVLEPIRTTGVRALSLAFAVTERDDGPCNLRASPSERNLADDCRQWSAAELPVERRPGRETATSRTTRRALCGRRVNSQRRRRCKFIQAQLLHTAAPPTRLRTASMHGRSTVPRRDRVHRQTENASVIWEHPAAASGTAHF